MLWTNDTHRLLCNQVFSTRTGGLSKVKTLNHPTFICASVMSGVVTWGSIRQILSLYRVRQEAKNCARQFKAGKKKIRAHVDFAAGD